MAESDPKKIRPFGKSSERRDFDTEEDPLVELARIVSEDRGAQGARPVRAVPQPSEPTRSAYSADLEAELLQELESSFSPRAPAKVAAPRAAVVPPQPQADDSDQLLRSIEAQLGDYERRAPARPERPVAAHSDESLADPRGVRARRHEDENAASRSAEQQGWEPVAATPFPRVDPRQRAPVAPGQPQTREDRPALARDDHQPRRPDADRPIPHPERDMTEDEPSSRLPLRRRDRPDAQEARPHQDARAALSALPAAGWTNVIGGEESRAGRAHQDAGHPDPADYRGELRTTFDDDASRNTARRSSAGAADDGREFVSKLEPTYSDPTLDGHWEGEGSGFTDDAADEPRVAPARASGSGSKAAARKSGRGSRKGLLAAAGVLGVLVLGGAVLGLMRSGEEAPSGPPPVIAAPSGDTKVAAPEQQQAEGETAGEAVYDRVAGATPEADEQVVEGAEEPRELSRIVLPPPENESDDALVKAVGDETAVASADANGGTAIEAVAIGPRRVRTYVVRPDGTITASGAAPAPAPAPEPAATAVAAPIEPVRVATTSVKVGDAPAPSGAASPTVAAAAPATPAPAAPAQAPAASGGQLPADVELAPTASELPGSEQDPADVGGTSVTEPTPPPTAGAPAAEAPAEAASVAPAEAPAQVASVAPAEPAPAAAAPSGSGGYVMQVSSQRSMNEAQSALAAMKQRYASIVGNLETEVLEANLGDKGVYYRARIGRWESRAEAVEVCEALQAAGGSCFVTR
jgi:hypothetical protein